jgi:hypothetical protein
MRIASLLTAVIFLGCGTSVTPTASHRPFETPPSSSPDTPPSVTPTPRARSSASPNVSPSELERSDTFWDLITSGEGPDEIRSLKGAIGEADLVVVGRFTEVGRLGRAVITIDEVLSGQPETRLNGTVTLQLPPISDTQLLQDTMPSHRHLLFLFYVPAFLERHGRPIEEQEAQRFDYIPMHGTQAVIRDISGTAYDILIPPDARFPDGFEGQSFDAVVDRTRRLAERLVAY